ncbi:SprT-like domain-containing protein [Algoriphagus halophytocola]|uniref:SprT-like domain-containing protein n=1 Tax=Algoriphagus halophytocola TaxID=2991499 RepID=A0ABY6ME64_9BACT|nr:MULTISPECIES: SprT-like domain-containing protein [unclassified Algoriphagus]UZD21205.1 SprT-like domain-containing protein [Algoriphagus sp. TR-M5]WBL42415.1 SprT-like domain-containing protein [Algoriphagus sp. TR-M9]
MQISDKLQVILSKHVPKPAVAYCLSLWQQEPFSFQVTASRKTKLGDFRFRKNRSTQTITINADLNPYQFLLTYIHEVAHLHAFVKYSTHIAPHGKEWKQTFQQLMSPVLSTVYFPIDLLIPLRKHMLNPKASSARDLFLMKEMSKYDLNTSGAKALFLSDLKSGNKFELSGRVFEKIETKRTRVLCEEISSGKKYLIAQLAKVKLIDE